MPCLHEQTYKRSFLLWHLLRLFRCDRSLELESSSAPRSKTQDSVNKAITTKQTNNTSCSVRHQRRLRYRFSYLQCQGIPIYHFVFYYILIWAVPRFVFFEVFYLFKFIETILFILFPIWYIKWNIYIRKVCVLFGIYKIHGKEYYVQTSSKHTLSWFFFYLN